MPEDALEEEIMIRIIHYAVLVFIVFVCAEISNVLFYEAPYSGEPVSIWNETGNEIQPTKFPLIKFL